jgi:hypothetical protein
VLGPYITAACLLVEVRARGGPAGLLPPHGVQQLVVPLRVVVHRVVHLLALAPVDVGGPKGHPDGHADGHAGAEDDDYQERLQGIVVPSTMLI